VVGLGIGGNKGVIVSPVGVPLGTGKLGLGPVGIGLENENEGIGNPPVGNGPVGREKENVKPVGIGRREKVKPPVGTGNPPVGKLKERVGRGKPPVPGKENDGNENGPEGKPGNGAVPVGRGKEKLPVGKGGVEESDGKGGIGGTDDTGGSGVKDRETTSDEDGAEKLGNVVAGMGKDTLPPGRVVGGNGRIGIVVGRVNGGAVLLVDSITDG
jgi:hypothetical protein